MAKKIFTFCFTKVYCHNPLAKSEKQKKEKDQEDVIPNLATQIILQQTKYSSHNPKQELHIQLLILYNLLENQLYETIPSYSMVISL